MVSFGLVGVGFREVGDRPIEALALAQVGGDLHTVSGTGMRTGQRPAADPCIKGQFVWRQALYLRRALHVSQLSQVEVATGSATKPAEEDVPRGLHKLLAGNDALPPILVGALWEVGFQHRSFCFLDLEKQRIVFVTPLEQHDEVSGADASYPYDLPRHVHEKVFVKQVRPVVLKAAFVHLQNLIDSFPALVVHDADRQRWIVFDHPAAIDDPDQLGEGLQPSAAACLPHGFFAFPMVFESVISSRNSSTLTREYQTSSSPISENSAIRIRYEVAALRAASSFVASRMWGAGMAPSTRSR